MPDKAVNGALNQWMHSMRGRLKQMVLTIDPKHAHILPQTNGSILDYYRIKSSLCAFVCRGLLRPLILHSHCTGVYVCVFNPRPRQAPLTPVSHKEKKKEKKSKHIQVDRTDTRTSFCTFYLQNVLKFSVQHLTNEVQQIMHASLALCTHYYGLAIFVFAGGEVYKKEEEGGN